MPVLRGDRKCSAAPFPLKSFVFILMSDLAKFAARPTGGSTQNRHPRTSPGGAVQALTPSPKAMQTVRSAR